MKNILKGLFIKLIEGIYVFLNLRRIAKLLRKLKFAGFYYIITDADLDAMISFMTNEITLSELQENLTPLTPIFSNSSNLECIAFLTTTDLELQTLSFYLNYSNYLTHPIIYSQMAQFPVYAQKFVLQASKFEYSNEILASLDGHEYTLDPIINNIIVKSPLIQALNALSIDEDYNLSADKMLSPFKEILLNPSITPLEVLLNYKFSNENWYAYLTNSKYSAINSIINHDLTQIMLCHSVEFKVETNLYTNITSKVIGQIYKHFYGQYRYNSALLEYHQFSYENPGVTYIAPIKPISSLYQIPLKLQYNWNFLSANPYGKPYHGGRIDYSASLTNSADPYAPVILDKNQLILSYTLDNFQNVVFHGYIYHICLSPTWGEMISLMNAPF